MKRFSSFRLGGKDSDKGSSAASSAPSSPPAMRALQAFLQEAELEEYLPALRSRLKVSTVEHLKYVEEQDLEDLGMTRPEMRRLKKFYRRENPSGTFNKLRKALRGDGSGRVTSPSPPSSRSPRPTSSTPYVRPPGKQLISPDSLSVSRVLGDGEFGRTSQAMWTTDTGEKVPVSVKQLDHTQLTRDTEAVLGEAKLLQELDHEHLAHLYGVVCDQGVISLVTELAPLRSLLGCLKDPTMRPDLGLPRLCDFAQHVCDACAYLEARRLVHRDLAARSVLVFDKTQVKVSDVSLSGLMGSSQEYYHNKAIAWMAPEVLSSMAFSSSSDVWAFGVLLWELFSYGAQPWGGLTSPQIISAVCGEAPQCLYQPDLCTLDFYGLMKECWVTHPDDRPTFASLLLRLPQLRPTQVKALKDCQNAEGGYVTYKSGDVIVVIDKMPATSNPPGLVWRGVLANGRAGLFDPTNVAPFIEPKSMSPAHAKGASLVRKESGRKSRKIRTDMISRPQNDLRHTGHIGYDGAVFGDVGFIGDNYDKLPIKVAGASRGSSMNSINRASDALDHNGHMAGSASEHSLRGQSWLSRDSLASQSTFRSDDGRASPSYLDMEDDSLFADFKMPELGSSFDFGPSFMDEVLKALDDKERQVMEAEATPTEANGNSFEDEIKMRGGPPKAAPRAEVKSAAPPLPAQPPRVEPPKEKKQAKVKPMSASDEKAIDIALVQAKELTDHIPFENRRTPPVSPATHGTFFNSEEESGPGIMSKLKNSFKRTISQESEGKKRTFSEGLESKVDDSVPPEAQQAYNMLVTRGSVKENNSHPPAGYLNNNNHSHSSPTQDSTINSFGLRASEREPEPDLIRDSRQQNNPPSVASHISSFSVQSSSSQLSSNRPVISAPQLQTKPVGASNPAAYAAPVPAPRPPARQDSYEMKSEIPVPKPRPEVQRVEPTFRQQTPESPDLPSKTEKCSIDLHIPSVPARQDSRDQEREQLKRTIEIVRVDNTYQNDDSVEKVLTLDRTSQRSSQRSSLERSDKASDNAESQGEEWEYSSDSSKPSHDLESRANTSFSSIDRKDSLTKMERKDSLPKKQNSFFDESEFDEPSPHEIMSKLRAKRLATKTTAREPQGIPGRMSSVDTEQQDGEQETNPLRMLRGGAIPIRAAGKPRGLAALRRNPTDDSQDGSAGRRIVKR